MPKASNLNLPNIIITLVLLLILSLIGVLMQISAGQGHYFVYAFSQTLKVLIGFIILFTVAFVRLSFIYVLIDIIYVVCLVLIVLVSLLGTIHLGAQRWIHIGYLVIQPSELMKIALIVSLAKILAKIPNNQEGKLKSYILPGLLSVIPFLLVLMQPDLGTALIILFVTTGLFFISGFKLRYFTALGILGVIIAPILWFNLYPYQQQRILTFINPSNDPLGSGYHIIQSEIAIGSGGLMGKGYLKGSQSQLNFIPEKQTDFVFALLTEEFGFLGALCLLLIYAGLLINNIIMALKCNYAFGRYTILGITLLLFIHIFINIGMVSGIIPVVGVPLPLISFGGTSMTALMAGFGLILNIARNHSLN